MYFNKSIRETLDELKVDKEFGLSSEEAKLRLEKYGKNKVVEGKKKSLGKMIWEQLNDPLIFILAIAAVISGITSEISDSIIIALVVVINAVIGVSQELKAEKSMDALKKLSTPHAYVRRDGEIIEIASEDVVIGDVIILDAGRYVPCDMRLIETRSLQIEESALTGESLPVTKHADFTTESMTALGDLENMAFSTTLVTGGRGEGVAVYTGMNTEIGKIASMLNHGEEKTPLQVKLAEIGKILGVIALGICVIMFIIGLVQQRNLFDMFMLAISLAVAAVPEGMPAIVSIVLAMGVRRMVKQNAIIRKLPAVETLGSVSVICSDKTGTLTINKMTVRKYYFNGKEIDSKAMNLDDITSRLMLEGMVLCSDATETTGDPTEIALIDVAKEYGLLKAELNNKYVRVGEAPFDSDRKLMSTVNRVGDSFRVYTKGATDNLLEICDSIYLDNEIKPLTKELKDDIIKATEEMSNEALRVLGMAYKNTTDGEISPENMEKNLIFVGFTGMIDPPRMEVKDSIRICQESGIKTVMITGDHIITALAIARELGIADSRENCMSGLEIDSYTDEEFSEKIKSISVFARVSPEHKVKIVKAFKSNGAIVSMTGDGVNDAPSLKVADIGVAMGITGTDVAKNAADMTLLDDNFTTIVKAVEEGRNIFNNIRKSIFYLLSCNIGEIFAILISVLLGFPTPLQSIHLLWVNLVTDTSPALSLGVDPEDKDVMKERPRDAKSSFFKGRIGFLIFNGLLIGLITMTAFIIGVFTYTAGIIPSHQIQDIMSALIKGVESEHNALMEDALVHAQTMAFMVLSISQLFHSFNLRSSTKSIFSIGVFKNKFLVGSFILGILLQVLIVYIPFLSGVFHVHSLDLFDWAVIFGLSILPVVIYEIFKLAKNIRRR